MDKNRVVQELWVELNMQLHATTPDARPISEDAVRFILQALENLGYRILPQHQKSDSANLQALGDAVLTGLPEDIVRISPVYPDVERFAQELAGALQQSGRSALVLDTETMRLVLQTLDRLDYKRQETTPIAWEDIDAAQILQDLASKGWTILPPE